MLKLILFFFQAEDGIRDSSVTGVQTCALPILNCHPDFQLVISYNPGYQSLMKDLKQSTKQRFGAIDFDYPGAEVEAEIIMHETRVDKATAEKLVQIAHRARNLKGHGLDEGISTRLLTYAGALIAKGIAPRAACQ